MSWLSLALLAPLLYAIINLLDDNLLRYVYRTPHAGAAISGIFGIVPATIVVILDLGGFAISLNLLLLSLLSGFLVVVSFFYYFKGLEKANPSVVAAILCLTPVILPFLAYFIVGERLTASAITGFIILIACGFVYTLLDTKKFTISKALAPILVAAVALDIVALTNKYVYQRLDFYTAYTYASIGMVIGGIFFLVLLKRNAKEFSVVQSYKKYSRKIILLLITAEAISTLAGYLFDRALSLGQVSLVTALGNLQPFYVLFLAVLLYPFRPQFFREAESDNLKYKFLLSIIMVFGVYLLIN